MQEFLKSAILAAILKRKSAYNPPGYKLSRRKYFIDYIIFLLILYLKARLILKENNYVQAVGEKAMIMHQYRVKTIISLKIQKCSAHSCIKSPGLITPEFCKYGYIGFFANTLEYKWWQYNLNLVKDIIIVLWLLLCYR